MQVQSQRVTYKKDQRSIKFYDEIIKLLFYLKILMKYKKSYNFMTQT